MTRGWSLQIKVEDKLMEDEDTVVLTPEEREKILKEVPEEETEDEEGGSE